MEIMDRLSIRAAEAAVHDLKERFSLDMANFQDDNSGLLYRCPCLRIWFASIST